MGISNFQLSTFSAAIMLPRGLLKIVLSAGEDGLLLAYSAAVEQVMPPMEPPPATPACQGCTPWVDIHEANYSGSGDPKPGDVTSIFSLHFSGVCDLNRRGNSAEETSKGRTQSHTEL